MGVRRSRPPQVVPFRDSKLTRVLQGFFCGRGTSSMVVNINTCASIYDETLQALKFSAIASQVSIYIWTDFSFLLIRPKKGDGSSLPPSPLSSWSMDPPRKPEWRIYCPCCVSQRTGMTARCWKGMQTRAMWRTAISPC